MSWKESKTIRKSISETREYHTRYLRAINNPLRRKILKAFPHDYVSIDELQTSTGLDKEILKWHLNILMHGFCVEKEINQGNPTYKLTQEGRVVYYME